MTDEKSAFDQDVLLDEPGIIGARWWQKSLQAADQGSTRRSALRALALGGGVIVGVGALGTVVAVMSEDDYTYSSGRALKRFQRRYGWSFGAADVPLVFDGASQQPFDPKMIDDLERTLTPSRYLSLHVPTLFDALLATPKERPAEETLPFVPLRQVLRPIYTPQMELAFLAGRALADRYAAKAQTGAVLVNLPGPEAVAFAAGAAGQLEPVFLVNDWPHPRGVVPAHLVLAAAAYYQPLFEKRKAERPRLAPPVFVLDRARLAPYVNESSAFDNRWTARVPSSTALVAYAQDKLVYVAPAGATPPELDDLNDAFADLATNGMTVEVVTVDDQTATPKPWAIGRRSTVFSGGARPASFGVVPIVLAAGTGAVLGAAIDRRGSWNRASSYGGG